MAYPRLTAEEVTTMRQLAATGWTFKRLAERFNCAKNTAWSAVTGQTHKNVKQPAVIHMTCEMCGHKREFPLSARRLATYAKVQPDTNLQTQVRRQACD